MFDNSQDRGFTIAALSSVLQTTKDMVFIKDADLIYRGSSQSFAEVVGLNDPTELIGKTDFDIFASSELAKRYTNDDRSMMSSKQPLLDYIEPLPAIDGRPRYASTSKRVILDDDNNVVGLCGISRDITREYEAQVNYERELRYLFELPQDALGATLFDITGWRVVDSHIRTESCMVVSCYATVDEYISTAIKEIVDCETTVRFFKSFSREAMQSIYESGKRSFEMEYLRKFSDGSMIWVKSDFHLLIDPVNGHLSLLTILFDIDESKRKRDKIKHAAEKDSLTALLNREATMNSIEDFLANEGLTGTHALFLIDIDNFKLVNDTFGHQVGDRVITEIAALIKDSFRDTDIVGRIGGDEFFVLMKNVDSQRRVRHKAQSLVHVLQHVCATPTTRIELSASVGIGIFTNGNKSLETLYQEADLAMYRSKNSGKNRFTIYSSVDEGIKSLIPQSGSLINTVNLHALLNKIDAGIIIYHAAPNDKYASPIFISESFLAMVGGISLEEAFDIYQGDSHNTIHPEDRERVIAEYDLAIREDKALRSEYRVVGRGGAYYRMIVASNITTNTDGSLDIYSVYTKSSG